MKKNHWKLRLLIWYCRRILKVPYLVNFTPAEHEDVYAWGLAWSEAAAQRLRGDDRLIERVKRAESMAVAMSGSRKGRKTMNRAARRAAEKELKRG